MLGSINPESLDSKTNEIIDIVCNLSPDIVLASIKIIQTNQVAVADIVGIIVVVDITDRLVEVQVGIWDTIIILSKKDNIKARSGLVLDSFIT